SRRHTLEFRTPLHLASLTVLDSRKAKRSNGVHPRMVSYSPTERVGEPICCRYALTTITSFTP
ncbi:MAG TPA: hypothetical protein VNQ73_10700, partial [Ilumatobacter sp.]|nr:hypothetical protein [Ilumatobacter sp.]